MRLHRPTLLLLYSLGVSVRAEPITPGPAAPASVLVEAQQLVDASRLPEAREPLEALLKREPHNVDAALLLAKVHTGLARRDEAIALLEPFAEKHPDDARVVGAYAEACLRRASELTPGFRALRLARRGREAMERAVSLSPETIYYREGLVEFYRRAPGLAGGSIEKALLHAAEIARRDPVRGAAWQSTVFVQEKRHDEAFAACDAALAASPDAYMANFILGRTAAESGLRLEDGEAALRRCLTLTPADNEPPHDTAWYWFGRVAEHRGNIAEARTAYAKALEIEPHASRYAAALKRLGKGE